MVLSLVLRAALLRGLVRLRESRLGGPVAAALLVPGSLTPLLVLVALVRPAGGVESVAAPVVAAPVAEALAGPTTAPPAAAPPAAAPLAAAPAVAALVPPPLPRAVPRGEHRDGPCPVLIAHGQADPEDAMPDEPAPPDASTRASTQASTQASSQELARAEAAALDPGLGQLHAALGEARDNVEKARALAAGATRDGWSVGRFSTSELAAALLECDWVTSREAGEVQTLLREARWLAALDPTGPEPARRSWEDVRFLCEGIAWYLGCAHAQARRELGQRAQRGFVDAVAEPAPAGPPPPSIPDGPPLDRSRLRDYAGLETYEDLLAEWD